MPRVQELDEDWKRHLERAYEEASDGLERWLEHYLDELYPIKRPPRKPSYKVGDLKELAECCRLPLEAIFGSLNQATSFGEALNSKERQLDKTVTSARREILAAVQNSSFFDFEGVEDEPAFLESIDEMLAGLKATRVMYIEQDRRDRQDPRLWLIPPDQPGGEPSPAGLAREEHKRQDGAQIEPPTTPSAGQGKADSEAAAGSYETRTSRLDRFRKANNNPPKAAVWRAADVNRQDGYRWEKGNIPDKSVMAERIEDVIAGRRKLSTASLERDSARRSPADG